MHPMLLIVLFLAHGTLQQITDITQVPAYSALATCPASIVSAVIDDSTSPICPAGSPPHCFCANEGLSSEWSNQISTNILNSCLTSARPGATQAAAVFASFCSLALAPAQTSSPTTQSTESSARAGPQPATSSLANPTSTSQASASSSSSTTTSSAPAPSSSPSGGGGGLSTDAIIGIVFGTVAVLVALFVWAFKREEAWYCLTLGRHGRKPFARAYSGIEMM